MKKINFALLLFLLLFSFYKVNASQGALSNYNILQPNEIFIGQRAQGTLNACSVTPTRLDDLYFSRASSCRSQWSYIAIKPNIVFKKDTYYSMTIYYNISYNNSLSYYTRFTGMCQGAYSTCVASGNSQNFNVTPIFSEIPTTGVIISTSNNSTTGYMIRVIFKATASTDWVAFYLESNNSNFGYINVYGYQLLYEGSDSSSAIQSVIDNQNDRFDDIDKGINDLQEKEQEQLEQQKETNDYLMDDTEPSSDISSLGNVSGLLPPGPLDSLLNIPFKFLSVLTSSLGDVCVPLSGEFIEGATLTLPCFGDVFYSEVPDNLMIFINLIPSCFILINYFKHLYKKVERATSMNSSTDDEWGVI